MRRKTKAARGSPGPHGPEVVLRNGKPTAVILDIEEYRAMLERLEETEDLKALKALRRKPLRFRKLEDFLEEHV